MNDIVIIPLAGEIPVRHVSSPGAVIDWTPDGRALTYLTAENLWVEPLDGGTAKQLTHFTDGRHIINFTWSHNGQQLAVSRAVSLSDIVMLKGLK